ncbi:TraR/DksA family transcriptional regulator [Streptomyces sp. NPDC048659]|uniref:TraR/DksA family transcriptional regulator n=1 Tax=Streptomyces sp. NPDC048659 TaxID=3155489 RepID=UPI003417972D
MVAKKTAAKKTTAARKTASAEESAPAEKAAEERAAPVKKAAAAKKAAPAKKATAKKATATTAAKKAAKKAAPAKAAKAAKKAPAKAAKAATEKTGARTVAAKKTAGGVTTAPGEAAVPHSRPGELAVRPGEDPWTPEEIAEARSGLQAEVLRLRSELVHSQEELTGLMRDSGDGAGDDQADTGTKNITREHELSLAANAREMLEQSEHALERMDAGTYGLCEVCGKPIGKARMQAFPRATLCVEDKQRQERRG